jgi:Zn-dependent protease
MFPPGPQQPKQVVASPPATGSSTSKGSFRLFRLFGTDVFVHWSWFLMAYYEMQNRQVPYSSKAWIAVEYLAGFGLVLLHEFGHVMACRQVGGTANRVVLWPLGGLAFVSAPPRPGASLWTTVAGPLVNVVLAPVLLLLAFFAPAGTDIDHLCERMALFNVVMLVFNLLPIFPLDGGRILQAILWWMVGLPWSLIIAGSLGIIAGAGLGILAIAIQEWWLGLMAAFLIIGAVGGVSNGVKLDRMVKRARQAQDSFAPTV